MQLWDMGGGNACPAGRIGGPFHDMYSRSPLADDYQAESDLRLNIAAGILNKSNENDGFIVCFDITMLDLVKRNLELSHGDKSYTLLKTFHLDELSQVGRVKVQSLQDAQAILTSIGEMGATLSRELMLRVFTHEMTLKQAIKLLEQALSMRLKKKVSLSYTKPANVTKAKHALEAFTFLIEDIDMLLCADSQEIKSKSNRFYLETCRHLLIKLQNELPNKYLTDNNAHRLIQSITRIHYLLMASWQLDRLRFNFAIGLVFDEIKWALSCASLRQEAAVSPNDPHEEVATFFSKQAECECDATLIGSSGMNVYVRTFEIIRKLFKEKRFSIFLSKRNYYEFAFFLNGQFKRSVPGEKALVITIEKGRIVEKEKHPREQITDVYVATPESNALVKAEGNVFTDINHDIERQLVMREEASLSESRPLYVILDMTMSQPEDTILPWLLFQFEDAIKEGKLIIMPFYSLNKMFTMGLDKGHMGVAGFFFNIEKHQKLLQAVVNNRKVLGGYRRDSAQMQFITFLMRYATNAAKTYYHATRGRTRFIHERVLPFDREDGEDSFFYIDNPYQQRTYHELTPRRAQRNNIWPFVMLRNDAKKYSFKRVTYGAIINLCISFLHACGFQPRDGYGFADSTLSLLNTKKTSQHRIAVGNESQRDIEIRFGQLKQFLHLCNKTINQFCIKDKKGTYKLPRGKSQSLIRALRAHVFTILPEGTHDKFRNISRNMGLCELPQEVEKSEEHDSLLRRAP